AWRKVTETPEAGAHGNSTPIWGVFFGCWACADTQSKRSIVQSASWENLLRMVFLIQNRKSKIQNQITELLCVLSPGRLAELSTYFRFSPAGRLLDISTWLRTGFRLV